MPGDLGTETSPSTNKRVLVVGDIRLYREGIAHALQEHFTQERAEVQIVTASSREEALEVIASRSFMAVLLDFAMFECLLTIEQLTASRPELRVIVLTVPESERDVFACANAGASGYVTRRGSLKDLVTKIQHTGESTYDIRMSHQAPSSAMESTTVPVGPKAALSSLTKRERHILGHIENGMSNKEIARTLNLELSTVKNHVHNILNKLHVHRRGEAAAISRTLY